MSRIRSLHPGLFTDDRYMALSLAARELVKGIWCECDDQGIFEWRPLTLKARVLPADAVDVNELLNELIVGKFVTRFEFNGRSFGAVRNFRKFQRPKKPNSVHLLPPELRTYVGLPSDGTLTDDDKSPSVPHQGGNGAEEPPQMEDGGGRREEGKNSEPNGSGGQVPPAGDPVKALWDRGATVLGEKSRSLLGKARREHGDIAVLEALSACETEHPSDPAGFFIGCLARRRKQPNSGIIPMHPGAGG